MRDEIYDEIANLVDEYGEAEFNFGRFQNAQNGKYAHEYYKKLMKEIDSLIEKYVDK